MTTPICPGTTHQLHPGRMPAQSAVAVPLWQRAVTLAAMPDMLLSERPALNGPECPVLVLWKVRGRMRQGSPLGTTTPELLPLVVLPRLVFFEPCGRSVLHCFDFGLVPRHDFV